MSTVTTGNGAEITKTTTDSEGETILDQHSETFHEIYDRAADGTGTVHRDVTFDADETVTSHQGLTQVTRTVSNTSNSAAGTSTSSTVTDSSAVNVSATDLVEDHDEFSEDSDLSPSQDPDHTDYLVTDHDQVTDGGTDIVSTTLTHAENTVTIDPAKRTVITSSRTHIETGGGGRHETLGESETPDATPSQDPNEPDEELDESDDLQGDLTLSITDILSSSTSVTTTTAPAPGSTIATTTTVTDSVNTTTTGTDVRDYSQSADVREEVTVGSPPPGATAARLLPRDAAGHQTDHVVETFNTTLSHVERIVLTGDNFSATATETHTRTLAGNASETDTEGDTLDSGNETTGTGDDESDARENSTATFVDIVTITIDRDVTTLPTADNPQSVHEVSHSEQRQTSRGTETLEMSGSEAARYAVSLAAPGSNTTDSVSDVASSDNGVAHQTETGSSTSDITATTTVTTTADGLLRVQTDGLERSSTFTETDTENLSENSSSETGGETEGDNTTDHKEGTFTEKRTSTFEETRTVASSSDDPVFQGSTTIVITRDRTTVTRTGTETADASENLTASWARGVPNPLTDANVDNDDEDANVNGEEHYTRTAVTTGPNVSETVVDTLDRTSTGHEHKHVHDVENQQPVPEDEDGDTGDGDGDGDGVTGDSGETDTQAAGTLDESDDFSEDTVLNYTETRTHTDDYRGVTPPAATDAPDVAVTITDTYHEDSTVTTTGTQSLSESDHDHIVASFKGVTNPTYDGTVPVTDSTHESDRDNSNALTTRHTRETIVTLGAGVSSTQVNTLDGTYGTHELLSETADDGETPQPTDESESESDSDDDDDNVTVSFNETRTHALDVTRTASGVTTTYHEDSSTTRTGSEAEHVISQDALQALADAFRVSSFGGANPSFKPLTVRTTYSDADVTTATTHTELHESLTVVGSTSRSVDTLGRTEDGTETTSVTDFHTVGPEDADFQQDTTNGAAEEHENDSVTKTDRVSFHFTEYRTHLLDSTKTSSNTAQATTSVTTFHEDSSTDSHGDEVDHESDHDSTDDEVAIVPAPLAGGDPGSTAPFDPKPSANDDDEAGTEVTSYYHTSLHQTVTIATTGAVVSTQYDTLDRTEDGTDTSHSTEHDTLQPSTSAPSSSGTREKGSAHGNDDDHVIASYSQTQTHRLDSIATTTATDGSGLLTTTLIAETSTTETSGNIDDETDDDSTIDVPVTLTEGNDSSGDDPTGDDPTTAGTLSETSNETDRDVSTYVTRMTRATTVVISGDTSFSTDTTTIERTENGTDTSSFTDHATINPAQTGGAASETDHENARRDTSYSFSQTNHHTLDSQVGTTNDGTHTIEDSTKTSNGRGSYHSQQIDDDQLNGDASAYPVVVDNTVFTWSETGTYHTVSSVSVSTAATDEDDVVTTTTDLTKRTADGTETNTESDSLALTPASVGSNETETDDTTTAFTESYQLTHTHTVDIQSGTPGHEETTDEQSGASSASTDDHGTHQAFFNVKDDANTSGSEDAPHYYLPHSGRLATKLSEFILDELEKLEEDRKNPPAVGLTGPYPSYNDLLPSMKDYLRKWNVHSPEPGKLSSASLGANLFDEVDSIDRELIKLNKLANDLFILASKAEGEGEEWAAKKYLVTRGVVGAVMEQWFERRDRIYMALQAMGRMTYGMVRLLEDPRTREGFMMAITGEAAGAVEAVTSAMPSVDVVGKTFVAVSNAFGRARDSVSKWIKGWTGKTVPTAQPRIQAPTPRGTALLLNNACFAAGTHLLIPAGSKPIEQFEVGDLILSRSEHDPHGLVEAKCVEETFVRSAPILELIVSDQTVRTTSEHPFYVVDQGWTNASDLMEGDKLASHNGAISVVQSIRSTNEMQTVYNMRIADFHTYFVGCRGWGFSVWAHNACKVSITLEGGEWVIRNSKTGQVIIHEYRGRNFNPATKTPEEIAASRKSIEARFQTEAEALEYAKDYGHSIVKKPGWLNPDVAVRQLGDIDCSVWASMFQKVEGGQVMHLKPTKLNVRNQTGALPGEVPARYDYLYHSFVVKDGKVFDQLNPTGVPYADWVAKFKEINNRMTDEQFSRLIIIDSIPHPGATVK